MSNCKTSLSSFHNSFIPSTTRLWNQLSESGRQTASVSSFNKLIWGQFGKFLPPTLYSEGTKLGNGFHTQLRVGVSPLNAHMYVTFNSVPSPACLCAFHTQDTKHFVLFCSRYAHLRDRILTSVEVFISLTSIL